MLGPSEPIVSGRAAGHNSDKVFGSLFYVWQRWAWVWGWLFSKWHSRARGQSLHNCLCESCLPTGVFQGTYIKSQFVSNIGPDIFGRGEEGFSVFGNIKDF